MRTGRFIIAAVIAALALPAAAGSWPNLPARKPAAAKPLFSLAAVPPQSRDGFVEEAGDAVSSLEQYRYFSTEEYRGKGTIEYASEAPRAATTLSKGGFEYLGGDTGWQLSQHKYVRVAGKFVHSEECDHAVRTVKAPTAEDIEEARKAYPGA